jgi:hypothetical protein
MKSVLTYWSEYYIITLDEFILVEPRWRFFSPENPLAGEFLASRLAIYAENIRHGRFVYGNI